jgi:plastocyanin
MDFDKPNKYVFNILRVDRFSWMFDHKDATEMHRILIIGGVFAFLATLGSLGFALGGGAGIAVSQKGRAFMPNSVQIETGEKATIHNDDEYIHHVFIDSPDFHFDSGEQRIGQTVEITFTVPGTFRVLCAIHPKMRLDVTVK